MIVWGVKTPWLINSRCMVALSPDQMVRFCGFTQNDLCRVAQLTSGWKRASESEGAVEEGTKRDFFLFQASQHLVQIIWSDL